MNWKAYITRSVGVITNTEQTAIEMANGDAPLGIWRLGLVVGILYFVGVLISLVFATVPIDLNMLSFSGIILGASAFMVLSAAIGFYIAAWINAILIWPTAKLLGGKANIKQTFRTYFLLFPVGVVINVGVLILTFLLAFTMPSAVQITVDNNTYNYAIEFPMYSWQNWLIILFSLAVTAWYLYIASKAIAAINEFSKGRAFISLIALPLILAILFFTYVYMTSPDLVTAHAGQLFHA